MRLSNISLRPPPIFSYFSYLSLNAESRANIIQVKTEIIHTDLIQVVQPALSKAHIRLCFPLPRSTCKPPKCCCSCGPMDNVQNFSHDCDSVYSQNHLNLIKKKSLGVLVEQNETKLVSCIYFQHLKYDVKTVISVFWYRDCSMFSK